MSKFNQINYIYILDKLYIKYKKSNLINYIIKGKESFSFCRDIFNIIIKVIKHFKKGKFYLLHVGNQFHLSIFCEYINYIYPNIKIDKSKYFTIFKYKKTIIFIIKSVNLFIKLYKQRKQLIKKLKKKYSVSKINFVLFTINKNYHIEPLKFMFKKKYKAIIFRNCLEKLLKLRLLRGNNIEHLKLYKLIKVKEKFSKNISTEFIYTMYVKTKNLGVDYLEDVDVEEYLKSKLFNQDTALNAVLSVINDTDSSQKNTKKPIGSWLLCGPSGTGKTELAKILSYALFNSTDHLLKIDMSEYMEPHSISKLIGSPQGYVNYGEDTSLSAKFKQKSSLVIVFDEIEKAYKEFTTVMLQVLDEGKLVLATGEKLNFDKSFIIFTSNLGYSEKSKKKITKKFVFKKIKDFFRIEFLNRLTDIIMFDPIDINYSYNILNKFLVEYSIRFNFSIDLNKTLKDSLIMHTHDKAYGSRPLRRAVDYMFDTFNLNQVLFDCPKNYFMDYSYNTAYDNKVDTKFNFFKIN